METQTPNIKKSAANYGIILGVIVTLISVLVYSLAMDIMIEWWYGIIMFLIALTVGILSTAKAKSLLGGFISFKEAFTAYFITIAIGLFISVLVGILLFVVIDPDAAVTLQEKVIESTVGMMERFGAPEESVNEVITNMEGQNSFSAGNQLQSFLIQLVFYSVFGLLVALIMKRKDPNAA